LKKIKQKTKNMKTISGILILAVMVSYNAIAGNFKVNVAESKVTWFGKKVTGEHNGPIKLKNGFIAVENGKITGGKFEMDMNSIDNNDLSGGMKDRLVGHLKSDDFFSVSAHPVSTLVLTSVTPESGNKYTFKGDLTIKGITHPVEFSGSADFGNSSLNAKGKMLVDRSLYNVRYGSGKFFEGLGDRMIYDEFTLEFTLVAEQE